MKFEDGFIDNEDGEFHGLYLLPLLRAMSDSSWDFPSAMMTLGLDEHFPGGEPTMYPGEREAQILGAIAFQNDESREEFIREFIKIGWDT